MSVGSWNKRLFPGTNLTSVYRVYRPGVANLQSVCGMCQTREETGSTAAHGAGRKQQKREQKGIGVALMEGAGLIHGTSVQKPGPRC